jgi:hypothetical protein
LKIEEKKPSSITVSQKAETPGYLFVQVLHQAPAIVLIRCKTCVGRAEGAASRSPASFAVGAAEAGIQSYAPHPFSMPFGKTVGVAVKSRFHAAPALYSSCSACH